MVKGEKTRGAARPGCKGGKKFENDSRGGEQVLPRTDAKGNQIKYREYDIKPFQKALIEIKKGL